CRVRVDDPVPVRRRAPGAPRDLALICLKCLEKDPRDRYPTAKELADDLGRFLAGEPVAVRPAGPVERLAEGARRQPALATAGGLAAVAVGLGAFAGFAAWLWQGAVEDRGTARAAQAEAEAAGRRLADANQKLDAALADARTARDEAARDRDKLAVFEYG